jgi:serine protease Do
MAKLKQLKSSVAEVGYMKSLLSFVLAAMVVFFSPISLAEAPAEHVYSLAPMLDKTTPAVVKITTEKDNTLAPFTEAKPQPSPEIGLGSGVIIDPVQGLIVTNAHVVSQTKVIVVTLKNGRRYVAKLIGEDDGFDIAVIKINAPNLTAIPLGDSDQLQVGDFVAAIGSPFGLTETVTSGVISALNRSEPKIEGYQSFIQTDTPINPGNSGGALVNMKGELIGVNTALVTPLLGNVGIGFAIPSNMVQSVVKQLVQYGKVERGILGVVAQDITSSLAEALNLKSDKGAVITTIIPESPAAKAGLKVADIILTLNDKPIHSSEQLRDTLGLILPGVPIQLSVLRDGKTQTISTVVGDPQKIAKQREAAFISGMQLQDFSELESNDTFLKGVLITGLGETSPGALAGLQPGDVITHANQKLVTSLKELEDVLHSKPKQLLLQVSRSNTGLFVVIDQDSTNS